MALPKVSKTRKLLNELEAKIKYLEQQNQDKENRISTLEFKVQQLENNFNNPNT